MSENRNSENGESKKFGVFATFAELLDALRNGKKEKKDEAWEAFLDRYGEFLTKSAKREMSKKEHLRRGYSESEFLASATAIIYAKLVSDDPPEYRSDVEFRGYLATIMYNKLTAKHRKAVVPNDPTVKLKVGGEDMLGANEDGTNKTLDDLSYEDDKSSRKKNDKLPEDNAIGKEMMELLANKLDGDIERDIALLWLLGYPVSLIVETVRCPKRTVERKIEKIKTKIEELKSEIEK